MTDQQALFEYRWKTAEEMLDDARKMLKAGVSPRSVVNRAYYAMFYAVLALFLKTKTPARTSKHSGIIGLFDLEFVKSGKLPKNLSQILHRIFDNRQEFDYKDYSEIEIPHAEESVRDSEFFLNQINSYLRLYSISESSSTPFDEISVQ